VGSSAGLDRCGKSRPHRDSIPGPSNPYPVAILTELDGPRVVFIYSFIHPYSSLSHDRSKASSKASSPNSAI
jgi:hypothetical protein